MNGDDEPRYKVIGYGRSRRTIDGDYCNGYADPVPTDVLLYGDTRDGMTYGGGPAILSFCPASFTAEATESLGGMTPSAGTSLSGVVPNVATVYHEIIRLVGGNEHTDDDCCKSSPLRSLPE